MKSTLPILLCAVALTAGCATTQRGANYTPLVDMQGKGEAVFRVDLQQCQGYAAERIDTVNSAVASAIAVGILGAILAPRGYRNEVAGRAAVLGAAAGAGEGIQTQEAIIKRCLSGRGYNVLN